MMPTFAVSNTFQTQSGPIPLSQLDGNFTDVVNYFNSTYTPFITATAIPSFAATATQQRTATATASFVTPSVQEEHPSAAKAWGFISYATASYVVTAGNNVASTSRGGTGTITVIFSNAFADANYAFIASPGFGASGIINSGKSAGTIVVTIFNTSNAAPQDADFSFVAFGTLA